MTNDLLEAIDRAVRSYFEGSNKSKIDMRQAMEDVRVCLNAEKKRIAQESTAAHRSHA